MKSYGASAAFDYASAGGADAVRAHTNNRLRYALDCITDAESVAFCYTALGRAGGRFSCLELCPENLQTRKAVKTDFVLALEIFGLKVDLSDGYARDANPKKYEAGVRWFQMFQKVLGEGKIRTHPVRLLDGGFEGILEGLKVLKRGDVSGQKIVVRLV